MKYLAPEPWSVSNEPAHRHWTNSLSIIDADGGEVAVLTRGYEGDAEGDDCPSWTNARVMAAAPDLLKQLKLMVELFDGYQGMELQWAKSVIAKAEGAELA